VVGPLVIFVVCLAVGVVAGSRWLPELAAGPVGGLAFFVVCGLLGAALGVVGLHVYSIVEELDRFGSRGFVGFGNGEIVATGLRGMLFEAGSLLGLAGAVYLLAPRGRAAGELASGPAASE
jgi:hypothetical protein